MRLRTIGGAQVSGLCVGGNPFSGFSHQNAQRNQEMLAYHTEERIHAVLRTAEEHGINTFFGRTDDHILGVLRAYWDSGSRMQWFAQVCTERGDQDSWRRWLSGAAELGAVGAYLHGGVVDYSFANREYERLAEFLARCRDLGVVAGFAGHQPEAHAWIRDHVDADFQMCSYYNPTDRSRHAGHIDTGEVWDDEAREAMLAVIDTIQRPVVHYKIFAGGNKPIVPAFQILGQHAKEHDVACIGVFLKDDPGMIQADVALFEEHVEAVGPR